MEDKIFSRKRLLIPKFKGFNHRNVRKCLNWNKSNGRKNDNESNNIITRKLIKTSIVIVIAVCIANRVISTIEPTMDLLCINMAKSIATQISNEQATLVMKNYKYDDLSTAIRDEQGQIKMIKMNIFVPVNVPNFI